MNFIGLACLRQRADVRPDRLFAQRDRLCRLTTAAPSRRHCRAWPPTQRALWGSWAIARRSAVDRSLPPLCAPARRRRSSPCCRLIFRGGRHDLAAPSSHLRSSRYPPPPTPPPPTATRSAQKLCVHGHRWRGTDCANQAGVCPTGVSASGNHRRDMTLVKIARTALCAPATRGCE